MTNSSSPLANAPSWQQSIHARCVHPTGTFVGFKEHLVGQSISHRFEQQVCNDPNRVAVKTTGHKLTYEALNKAANRVARAILEQRGQGQEPIALLFHHGAHVIVAMLGVLKAGKFYVPVAASYPPARISHILDDSQAALMLTNNRNMACARESTGNGVQLINVDTLDPSIPAENPRLFISPEAIIYILYTSGSTGQPNSVVQSHRNVLGMIMHHTNLFHVWAEDRVVLP